jgi:DNA-binding response OmpR family regulator
MSELIARVRSLMRRPPVLADLKVSFAGVVVDPQQQSMTFNENIVRLAPGELQIMLCLANAEGRTVRHSALEHAAWGLAESVTPNALEVALHRLRKKLSFIESPVRLVNVRNTGFALEPVRQFC